MNEIRDIASASVPLLLGGVAGGLIGALVVVFTWWIDIRGRIARDLLADGLAIHAAQEAWILEGPGWRYASLSDYAELNCELSAKKLWLRKVEIRAILDGERWISDEANFYGYIDGKRVWIVRDVLTSKPSYTGWTKGNVGPHPALMSSKGIHELCGWIERVSTVWSRWGHGHLFLSRETLKLLWPLLLPVTGEDRIAILKGRLTPRALRLLKWYRKRYMTRR